MDLSKPLSDAEYERLAVFLSSDATSVDCMVIDGADGFLTAIACGPEAVKPSEWLSVMWGKDEPNFESQQQAEDILGLIIRLSNSIADVLGQQGPIEPLVTIGETESGDEVVVSEIWCAGFLEGMRLRWDPWDVCLDELADSIAPILALGGDPEDPQRRKLLSDRALVDQLTQMLPEAVQAIYDFWRENEPYGLNPPLGPSPMTGFSEPCPCGSGKKYKDCCGASQLH